MPLIADMIRTLAARGASPEAIASAVEILELDQLAKEETRLAKKRAGNAERQQRYRDRQAERNALRSVTERYDPPPSPRPPTPARDPHARDAHAHAREISPDWKPSAEDIEYGRTLDLTAGQIDADACRFRDRALAAGERYRDPHAAFRAFLSSPHSPHRRSAASKPITVVNGAKTHAAHQQDRIREAVERRKASNPYFAGRG